MPSKTRSGSDEKVLVLRTSYSGVQEYSVLRTSMADLSPPIISLRPLRGRDAVRAPVSEDDHGQETHMEMGKGVDDATAVVGKVAASLKKFGCVCVPVSDLDTEEVCWPGHDVDKDPAERVVRCRTSCLM